MSNNAETTITLHQAIRKSAIGLAIFAFFTAGIIAITQTLTSEQITNNEREFEARLLLSLLPEGTSAENILNSANDFSAADMAQLNLLTVDTQDQYFQLVDERNQVTAVILPVIAPNGYTEAIRLIVGIDADGQVIGVRVTKHKETPGLGDQVEISKSDWILTFNGKSLANPVLEGWQVAKDGGDFDQLTGATITPRAIVQAVKQSLQFFEINKALLLTPNVSPEVGS